MASLIGATTYTVGKTVGIALKGTPALKKIKSSKKLSTPYNINVGNRLNDEIQSIKYANLFKAKLDTLTNSTNVSVKPKSKDRFKVCLESKRKSSLPVKLMDTIVMQDTVKSVASVQVRGAKISNFREGDSIKGLAEIGRIDDKKITIKNLNSGECEYIISKKADIRKSSAQLKILKPSSGKKLIKGLRADGIVNEGNKFRIKKSFRDKMLSPENMSSVLTQARAIQIKNPDGSLSFKITEIVPGSIYSQLSIQNNDIITHINGKKIQNLNQVMSLFGRIKDVDHFELGMKRNGSEQNFEYDFE